MISLTRSYRFVVVLVAVAILFVGAAIAFAAVSNGAGTMTVSPASVKPALVGQTFTFTFTNDGGSNFSTNSYVTFVVPAGWTAPQISNVANPGHVTVSTGTCGVNTTPTISGTGPWTITVTIPSSSCNNGDSFTLTYGDGSSVSKVTTPVAGSYTFTTASHNSSGGSPVAISSSPIVSVDGTAPTVTGVSSGAANGTYGVGSVVPVTVTFSEAVNVTGTPQIALNTGSPASTAISYASGSGTNTLTFNYTVAANNVSADLDYVGTGSLTLNGGTISDIAGNTATLTLPAPAAANSLGSNKNIIIDTVAPTVTNVTSTQGNGTYGVGTVIPVSVTFSKVVNVTGTPQLTLETGVTDRVLNYGSGTGTNTLLFGYTVQAGDVSADLDYQSIAALALNGGAIKDAGGNSATLTLAAPGAAGSLGFNKAIVIDGSVPTVTSVTSTAADGTYATGAVIPVTITFSKPVTVVGTPQLTLETGTTNRAVNYTSGSGTTVLTFTYTVQAGDASVDLDYLSTTALALNGGTIKDASTNPATLTLPSPGTSGSIAFGKAIVIDATSPTVTINQKSSAPAQADPTSVSPINFTVVFSKSTSDFATGDVTISGTAGGIKTATVTGSGTTYNVAVTGMTTSGTVIATVPAGVATDAVGNTNSASTATDNTVTWDVTAPVISVVTPVPTPGTDTTPTYTFTSSEAGTITYGGDCSAADTTANSGSNAQTFNALAIGTHSNCTITVTDAAGNVSNVLNVNSFTIISAWTLTPSPVNLRQNKTFTQQLTITNNDPLTMSCMEVTYPTGNFSGVSGAIVSAPSGWTVTSGGTGILRFTRTSGANPSIAANGGTATISISGTANGVVAGLSWSGHASSGSSTCAGTTIGTDQVVTVNITANAAPTAVALSAPADASITNNNKPTFSWTASTDANGDTISYELQADNSGSGFPSPEINQTSLSATTYTPGSALADGTYTWRVRAKDDLTASSYTATRTVIIDATAPNTTITSQPSLIANSTSAAFAFTSTEAGTFECKLDAAAFAPCTTPQNYIGLTQGSHTFQVRATDGAANTDATPASYTWTVDTVAPAIPTIDSTPTSPTNTTLFSYTFHDTEAGVTFQCRILNDGFAPCTSPFAGNTTFGTQTFEVKAIDAAGNESVVASHVWTIDQTAPLITLTGSTPVSVMYGVGYTDEGATATDDVDGTDTVVVSGDTVTATSPVGTYHINYNTTDAAGNAATQVVRTIVVGQATSVTTVSCPASVTYNGAAQIPCTATVIGIGGLSLTPTPIYTNNTNAGTANAAYTYAGDANHSGSTDNKDFAIEKANQTITFGALSNATYGDADVALSASSDSGLDVSFSTLSTTCSVSPISGIVHILSVGTCTVTASQEGDSNFNPATSVDRSFTIAPKGISVIADAKTKTYGDVDPALTYVSSDLSAVFSGTLDRDAGETVGTYAINQGTLSAGANYAISFHSANLSITKATSTTVITCPASVVYDGTAQEPCTVSVTGAGALSLTPTPIYHLNRNVGTATVNYSFLGDANHSASGDSKTFDITGRVLHVTATGHNKEYDGTVSATVDLSTDKAGIDDVTANVGTATFTDKNVGDAKTINVHGITITGADAGNYSFNDSTTASADITQKTLTVSAVGVNKPYDGNTTATVHLTDDRILGDVFTDDNASSDFVDADAGVGKTIHVLGISITGIDAGNYSVNATTDTTADITKAASNTVISCSVSEVYTGLAIEPCTADVTGAGGLVTTTTVTYDNNTDVGTATAHATYTGDANHEASTATNVTFDITKASSVTTINCPASDEFTALALTPCTASVTGTGGLNAPVAVDYTDNMDVGTASASATFSGDANHEGSTDATTFEITPAASVTVVTCPASVEFDGATQTPCSVSVTGIGGLSLTPDPTYTANINVGTANAAYTFAGDTNHSGSIDNKDFAITKAGSITTVTCPNPTEEYTGSAIAPCSATVTGIGGLNTSVSVDYTDNTNVGTATAAATFAGDANHTTSTDSKTFDITAATSEVTVLCPVAPQTYTGSAIEPCTAGYTTSDGQSGALTVSYADNIVVGTATANASYVGDANHTGNVDSKTFAIGKAASVTSVSCPVGVEFDGSAQTPCTASVTGAGGLSASVAVDYTENTNVGTANASATFSGDANHEDSTNATTFEITAAPSTTTITCPASQVYTGTAIETCTATVTGTGGLSESTPVTYADNTMVGTATANASFAGDSNHAPSSDSTTFVIDKAESSTVITCPTTTQTYTGAAQTPCTVAVTGVGMTTVTPDPIYTSNIHVGTAHADYTFIGDANHAGSSDSKTFDIGKTILTITPDNQNKTFGDTFSFTGTEFTSGDLATGDSITSITLTSAGTSAAAGAGTADIIGSDAVGVGLDNYDIHFNVGTMTIGKADSSTVITCPSTVQTYTGSAQTPCTADVTGAGGLTTTATVIYGNNTDAGTATANASYAGDDNHNPSTAAEATFAIGKASQIISVDPHAPATAEYNAHFTVGAISDSGLPVQISTNGPCQISGNDIQMISGTGDCIVHYKQAGDSNYNAATQIDETVAATKKAQTITFDALSNMNFGDSDAVLNATSDSGFTVSFSSVTPTTCSVTGSNVHIETVGTCTVRASQTGDSNYAAATSVDNSFDIKDNAAPVISGTPANFNVEATSAAGAVVSYIAPTATDDVDGSVAVNCIPASGTTLALGAHLITCTATDSALNASETTFTATVVDTTGPVIASHADVSAEATSAAGAIVTFTNPMGTDAVDGSVSVICIPASGSLFVLGGNTVTCTATDAASNSSQNQFTINVNDTTSPVVHVTAPVSGSVTGADTTAIFTATDNVSSGADLVVTCDVDGNLIPCSDTNTSLPLAGLTDGEHTFTVTAIDDNSNEAHESTTWTVDATAPTIDAHDDVVFESNVPAVVIYAAPATHDIVDGDGTATCLPVSGSVFAVGSTTVTCTATDSAGNGPTTSTFVVGVNDTTAPAAPVIDSTPTDPSNTTHFSFTFHDTEAGVTFECRILNDAFAPCVSPFDGNTTTGSQTFEVRAKDVFGNTSSAATFTWTIDTQGPVVTIDSGPTGTLFTNSGSFTFSSADAVSFGCSLDGIATSSCSSPFGFNSLLDGTHTFSVEGTDGLGNAGDAVSQSWVVDAVGPVITLESAGSPTDTSITVTWTTDEMSTSRVVFDTTPHAVAGTPALYGYASTTPEDAVLTKTHSVTVLGLTPGTHYYFRGVSHGSPETISKEVDNTTTTTQPNPQCSDGADNDTDGLIDSFDPGCHTDGNAINSQTYDPNDNDETDPVVTPTTGSLQVTKTANGGNATFSFTGAATFQITTNAGTGVHTITNLEPGLYSVVEDAKGGWTMNGNTCTNVQVTAGETATCVVTNTKDVVPPPQTGTLKVIKKTEGGDGTFSFTLTGANDFTISTHSHKGSEIIGNLTAGTYSVTEADKGGWKLTSNSCDNVTVTEGHTTVCTIVNTKVQHEHEHGDDGDDDNSSCEQQQQDAVQTDSAQGDGNNDNQQQDSNNTDDCMKGSITVLKQTVGGDDDFNFTASYKDGGFTLSNGEQYKKNGLKKGTYSVSEGEMADGWSQTSATCSDGSSPDAIDLAAGEKVTCTFVNTFTPDNTQDCDAGQHLDGNECVPDVITCDANTHLDAETNTCVPDVVTCETGTHLDTESNQCVPDAKTCAVGEMLNSDNMCVPVVPECTANQHLVDNQCVDNVVETPKPVCSDGTDNDGDLLSDEYDPGCHTDGDVGNTFSYNPNGTNEFNASNPAPQSSGGSGGGGGGGGNGPISGSSIGGGNGPISPIGGQVLGASTTLPELPAGCTALINSYMRKGKRNDTQDVKDLQKFLNDEMHSNLPVSGLFGSMTDKALKGFQAKYSDQVLTPWGLNAPTGFVYKTTQRWVNLIHCKDLNIPMPTNLIPYHNEDQ